MSAGSAERWYETHTSSRDGISVEVRFPNEVFLYPIDDSRWCWLRIGGVRFMLKNDELRDFAACVSEQVENHLENVVGPSPEVPA